MCVVMHIYLPLFGKVVYYSMTINDLKLAAKDDTLFWDVIYQPSEHMLEHGTYVYSHDRKRHLFLADNSLLASISLTPVELFDLLNQCEVDGRVNILLVDGKFLVHW